MACPAHVEPGCSRRWLGDRSPNRQTCATLDVHGRSRAETQADLAPVEAASARRRGRTWWPTGRRRGRPRQAVAVRIATTEDGGAVVRRLLDARATLVAVIPGQPDQRGRQARRDAGQRVVALIRCDASVLLAHLLRRRPPRRSARRGHEPRRTTTASSRPGSSPTAVSGVPTRRPRRR